MRFAEFLRHRRNELKLGLREACRLTDNPVVPSPIKSPVYLSRLENEVDEEMPASSASIDKLWGLGIALRTSPLYLFLLSRDREDLFPQVNTFPVKSVEQKTFGQFIRDRRKELGLSMREATTIIDVPWSVSIAYWSQMETDFRMCTTKISGEKLWSMGAILGVDPLLLYVMSRKIETRYLMSEYRQKLFS